RPDRPLNSSRGDQHVESAKDRPNPVGGGLHLLEIAHVGANAERVAAGLLDFQFGQVQFGLASREQSDSGAGLRKADREPLPDSPPGAGNQYALVSNRRHFSRSRLRANSIVISFTAARP